MIQQLGRMARPVGVAFVSLLLVAGGALAGNAALDPGSHSRGAVPLAQESVDAPANGQASEPTQSPEPTEAAETPEPASSAEPAAPAETTESAEPGEDGGGTGEAPDEQDGAGIARPDQTASTTDNGGSDRSAGGDSGGSSGSGGSDGGGDGSGHG